MEETGKRYKQCSIRYVDDRGKEGESVVAVIMELEGGRIRIHDDMMVKTKEENDLIVENVSRIMKNAAYRRMKEEQKAKEETA